jgi:hypothetical protein
MTQPAILHCPMCQRPNPIALGPIQVSATVWKATQNAPALQLYKCGCGFIFSVPAVKEVDTLPDCKKGESIFSDPDFPCPPPGGHTSSPQRELIRIAG